MRSSPLRIALDALAGFAFFSLFTSFVEATYSFGLLGTDIPPEIACVLFLLSPILLLLYPRLVERGGFMRVTGTLGFLFWAASLPVDTRWRMLLGGAGCGLFLLFFAARIRQVSRSPAEIALALGIAALVSILARAARAGNLLLADGYALVVCFVLAFLGVLMLVFSAPDRPSDIPAGTHRHGSLRSLGLSLGLFSALVLLCFAFASPAVVARWGAVSYLAVLVVEGATLALFLVVWLAMPGFRAPPGVLLLANLVFAVALALALKGQQPSFSPRAVYPLYAQDAPAFARLAFWAMLALHPVLYADFALFARALGEERPSPRGFVRGFAVSAAFVLLLVFAQVFTTVYDYIPVIGPWFRDKFWIVMSIPGIPLVLSVLLLGDERTWDRASTPRPAWAFGVAAMAAAAVLLGGLTGGLPGAPEAQAAKGGALRVLTYNLQQGYGKTGQKSYAGQLEAIRAARPDIVGLQETDTARLAGGNSDLVRFLADALGMYSCYGPSPESGTFGVALLSRYPIEGARTFFMPSRGEQTAAIDARITAQGREFHVLVTHLDNDGALPQQRLVVDRAVNGTDSGAIAIAMGDFNFSPSTEQYRVTTAVLEDAWVQAASRQVETGAPDPSERIDHIFLSKDTRVTRAVYLPEGPSDHPGVLAEIAW